MFEFTKFTHEGPWFNIKMSSYWYRKSHCVDKTVVRSSYLHNGISYTCKMTSLYSIRALVSALLIGRTKANCNWYEGLFFQNYAWCQWWYWCKHFMFSIYVLFIQFIARWLLSVRCCNSRQSLATVSLDTKSSVLKVMLIKKKLLHNHECKQDHIHLLKLLIACGAGGVWLIKQLSYDFYSLWSYHIKVWYLSRGYYMFQIRIRIFCFG